ncbi:MAG: hypothetical protein NVS1B14_09010 [Vulcanimicrobiaceae bacterium]
MIPKGHSVLRRSLAAISLLCIIALTGIGHRGPTPSPSPSPTPTPVPTPVVPVVMIYPFTVNGEADKRAGKKLADLFLAQMATVGGVVVKPIPVAPVERANYLTDAIKNGADYYISGYLTPLGDEVALVEQVVSTESGTVLWGNTAQVITYGDALTQADTIRKIIVQHSGRIEAAYRQQQTQATPTPGPDQQGASTSIGAILGLLKHVAGGKRAPAPVPSLAPEKKPLRAILVLGRDQAGTTLEHSLNRLYRVSNAGASSGNITQDARKICGVFPNSSIASGEVRKELTNSFPRNTIQVFTLRMYRCDGSNFFSHTARSNSLQSAIDETVAAYAAAHPDNS